jgi:type IV secretory pathway component VirB8
MLSKQHAILNINKEEYNNVKNKERVNIISNISTQEVQNEVNRFIDKLDNSPDKIEIIDIQFTNNGAYSFAVVRYTIPRNE